MTTVPFFTGINDHTHKPHLPIKGVCSARTGGAHLSDLESIIMLQPAMQPTPCLSELCYSSIIIDNKSTIIHTVILKVFKRCCLWRSDNFSFTLSGITKHCGENDESALVRHSNRR